MLNSDEEFDYLKGEFEMMEQMSHYELSRLKTRYEDLLKEAEEARLAKLATSHQSTFSSRIFSGVGDLLISSGLSLKERCRNSESQVAVLFSQAGQHIEDRVLS